jgi:hypothetical protein
MLIGFRFYKSFDKAFMLIFTYVVCAFIVESIGGVLFLKHIHNSFLFNLFLPVCVSLLVSAAISCIKYLAVKKVLWALLAVWWIIWLGSIIKNGFSSYLGIAFPTAFIFIALSYIIVILLLNNEVLKGQYKIPLYVACIAIVVFFGCNIPGYSVTSFLIKTDRSSASNVRTINNVLSITFYTMMSCAFVLKHRSVKKAVTPGNV